MHAKGEEIQGQSFFFTFMNPRICTLLYCMTQSSEKLIYLFIILHLVFVCNILGAFKASLLFSYTKATCYTVYITVTTIDGNKHKLLTVKTT